jgi:hypothetical protein
VSRARGRVREGMDALSYLRDPLAPVRLRRTAFALCEGEDALRAEDEREEADLRGQAEDDRAEAGIRGA